MEKEQNFDPLSFLSPPTGKRFEADAPAHLMAATQLQESNERIEDNVDERTETQSIPVHILDLPSIHLNPPYMVLEVILKILTPDETTNFGNQQCQLTEMNEEFITKKQIDYSDLSLSLDWLIANSSSLSTKNRLLSIHSLLYSSQAQEIIDYLTKIISSPLTQIREEQREIIWNLTSEIISSLLGRSAKSNFVRRINIDNLPEIQLKEPSITEDNIGLKTWGSSLKLSERLVKKHKDLLLDPILELGAGTGLIGITCGLLGYSDVMLTDLPAIIPNLRENIELNGLSMTANCDILDWSDAAQFLVKYPNSSKKYKTIILSDPIYSEQHPYWIQSILTTFLSIDSNSRVLLQIPIRSRFEDIRQLLWTLLDEVGLKEVYSEQENGFDDFGAQEFFFKIYKWKA